MAMSYPIIWCEVEGWSYYRVLFDARGLHYGFAPVIYWGA